MKQLIFLFIVFPCFACQPRANQSKAVVSKYYQLHKAEWLIGHWQHQSDQGILTEAWQRLNDSTFSGQSFFISNRDTLTAELISLEQRNGKLYYIPTVADQNDGKAVIFIMTSLTDSSATFENPEQDFPQRIFYHFHKPDSLLAEVSAINKGVYKSIIFRMGKAK
jgi:hypothetical protein